MKDFMAESLLDQSPVDLIRPGSNKLSAMKSFILCLAVVAVSGDAKPWTVAQVAAGAPALNALAEGRLHNVGVITNAAEAGVTQVGGVALNYAAPVVSYAAAVPALHHGAYYGKREADAEAYTPFQVATGQTNGGVITSVGGVPVVPHHAPVAGARVVSYAASPVHYAAAVPAVHHAAYYGKRDAEPYTLGQVATGQTNGGALTFVDAGHGTGHRPIVAAAPVVSYAASPLHYAAAVPALHHGAYAYYGKRDAEPYTPFQVATGQTNGGVITSVGGVPVVPHHAPVAGAVPAATYGYAAVPHAYGHIAYGYGR